MENLRQQLVDAALSWEAAFGNAPSITSSLSEHDAALLLGCSLTDYSGCMRGATAVRKGYDFVYKGLRYQVKGNRPSGKRGSKVTWVPKPSNYEWDRLIWVLYTPRYEMQEAWLWEVEEYRNRFEGVPRLGPAHMRKGHPLLAEYLSI